MRKRDAAVERASLYEYFNNSPTIYIYRFDLDILAAKLVSIRNAVHFSNLTQHANYYGV